MSAIRRTADREESHSSAGSPTWSSLVGKAEPRARDTEEILSVAYPMPEQGKIMKTLPVTTNKGKESTVSSSRDRKQSSNSGSSVYTSGAVVGSRVSEANIPHLVGGESSARALTPATLIASSAENRSFISAAGVGAGSDTEKADRQGRRFSWPLEGDARSRSPLFEAVSDTEDGEFARLNGRLRSHSTGSVNPEKGRESAVEDEKNGREDAEPGEPNMSCAFQ